MDKSKLLEKLLQYLQEYKQVDTFAFAKIVNVDHQKVVGIVKSLLSQNDLITAEPCSRMELVLTEEGQQVAKEGSHEVLVFNAIPPNGISRDELFKKVPDSAALIGLSKAIANRWIRIDNRNIRPIIRRATASVTDIVQEDLRSVRDSLDSLDAKTKLDYKKRKLIQEVVTKSFMLGKGRQFALCLKKAETDLTPEMIASGSWKDKIFKAYNFKALGVPPNCGTLHPLLKVRTEFRQIFLEMGFTEMPTNNYIESSFWNFDALFQPQQHPARDAHDTFFISSPQLTTDFPQSYLERVKSVHSSGGYGSQGYRYDWKLEEAQKNLLRTHTTAVSARMLYNLAQSGFKPSKYFSIDRVFRNETLDATHLAEFHQVEGVVADYNLSLGNLIGILHEFFNKLGLKSLKFKPAYNPYTEPSMEIFSYHPGLGKWIEVGNSGIFRPEMLRPMGLPENVNVIAWGLSLERPTMIKYGYNNIRDLVGPKVDLQMVKDSPICRLAKENIATKQTLDLENRLEVVINVLQSLRLEIKTMKNVLGSRMDVTNQKRLLTVGGEDTKYQIPASGKCLKKFGSAVMDKPHEMISTKDVVIEANPQYPPYTLPFMLQLLGPSVVSGSIHVHSSVLTMPSDLNDFCKKSLKQDNGVRPLNIVLIWRDIGKSPVITLPYFNAISLVGEVNVVRYLDTWQTLRGNKNVHVMGHPDPSKADYILIRTQLDAWLDLLHEAFVCGKAVKTAMHKLELALEGKEWLLECGPTVADIFMWSLHKSKGKIKFSPSLQVWFQRCCQFVDENAK